MAFVLVLLVVLVVHGLVLWCWGGFVRVAPASNGSANGGAQAAAVMHWVDVLALPALSDRTRLQERPASLVNGPEPATKPSQDFKPEGRTESLENPADDPLSASSSGTRLDASSPSFAVELPASAQSTAVDALAPVDMALTVSMPGVTGLGDLPASDTGGWRYALMHIEAGQIAHAQVDWVCCQAEPSSVTAVQPTGSPVESSPASTSTPAWVGWRLVPESADAETHPVLNVLLQQGLSASHMLGLAQAAQRLLTMQPAWPVGSTWEAPWGQIGQESPHQWRSETPDVLRLPTGRAVALRLSVEPVAQTGHRVLAWFQPELSPWPVRVRVDMPTGNALDITVEAPQVNGGLSRWGIDR